jgi:hypothetical protein
MKVLRITLATALAACVLSAGALGYPPDQRKGEQKGPPPKEQKVVPKEDKRPRSDDRRDGDRNRGNDNRKKGDG